MTWFTLSLLSIFALAFADLTQQHLLNRKNAFGAQVSTVFTFFFQFLLAIPFLFLFDVFDQMFTVFHGSIFVRILGMTFLSSVGIVFFFKSFQVKHISLSIIFSSFSSIVSTILGILFFSESTSVLKFFGIVLILSAIVFMKYKNAFFEKNHFYGLVSGCIFGICYTLDKGVLLEIHPLVYIFWGFLMIAVWGMIFGGKKIVRSLRGRGMYDFFPIIISGIGYFLYNILTFTAYRFGGEVGRIDAINNSEIFLIILFEFFILKQTKGVARKIFSTILAVAGIIVLGFVE